MARPITWSIDLKGKKGLKRKVARKERGGFGCQGLSTDCCFVLLLHYGGYRYGEDNMVFFLLLLALRVCLLSVLTLRCFTAWIPICCNIKAVS